MAKVVIQEQELILKEGEWSDWLRVNFEAVAHLAEVSGIVRFYLQQVHPELRLYATPLQINPEDPVTPISWPRDWSAQICRELGYFYTQQLAEDTKAFSAGLFGPREFFRQSQHVFRERERALEHLLKDYRSGFLFFYFSTVDQVSHMLWRYMDPQHPAHQPDAFLGDAIARTYRQMDRMLGRIRERLRPDATWIVLSDHGFAPFSWGVNLNTWLLEKGYVKPLDAERRGSQTLFRNVDWSGTRAYALGLNGLYLNVRGREKNGIVAEGQEYERLLDRLEAELKDMVDPNTGLHPVSQVIRTRRQFSGALADSGPDLVIGYARGYRSSWENPLGDFPSGIFVANQDAWSGDHGNDAGLVPGVLMSNRKITLPHPALFDLTVAVLDEYGIEKPVAMIGRDCLASRPDF